VNPAKSDIPCWIFFGSYRQRYLTSAERKDLRPDDKALSPTRPLAKNGKNEYQRDQEEAMPENFADRLAVAVRRCGNPVLVGLDPRVDNLPAGMLSQGDSADCRKVAEAFRQFCRDVVDVVAPLVPAVKPQAAFFEQFGPAGAQALADTVAYARSKGLIVIVDGKRNDIGSTATAYARGYLGSSADSPWGGDALTVSPYLGDDSLDPFVDVAVDRGAGVFVLVKTSNPGGAMFQDLVCDGQPLYRHVAAYVEQLAVRTRGNGHYGAIGAVAGATYPDQLAELRQAMPHTWLLIPGFGAQGAGARDVRQAFDEDGLGGIVNNSRGIIFAYERAEYKDRLPPTDWQRAVEAATQKMIAELRAETPAGNLSHVQ
jgi:orotidine-5'-phosphate decarboxylase